MIVINLTPMTQQVAVRHADGKLDSVQIMPKRRVELRKGMTVDVRWTELNPQTIRIVADPEPRPAEVSILPMTETVAQIEAQPDEVAVEAKPETEEGGA